MQMLDAQREKSMQRALDTLHLHPVPRFGEPFSVCFPFIPERVVLRCQNQRIRLIRQIFRQIWGKVGILPVRLTPGI